LNQILAGLKDNDTVLFAVITDAKKSVLASTFGSDAPKEELDEALSPMDGSKDPCAACAARTITPWTCLDGRALGQIRLGLNESYVSGVVATQTAKLS